MSDDKPLEIRFRGHGIDEVVGTNCDVHLEDLGGEWSLVITKGEQSLHLYLPYGNGAELLESNGRIRTLRDGEEVGDAEA